jgi:uncharacterized membrane protein YtjA (UPF0391 family)
MARRVIKIVGHRGEFRVREHSRTAHVFICEIKIAEVVMLRWALVFLILGLIAGVLGFTAIAGASIAIAKFLFFLFVAIFLVLLILGLTAARRLTGR